MFKLPFDIDIESMPIDVQI